jgi:Phage Tail Collar Domain
MTAQQPAFTMGGLSHSAELFRRARFAGWSAVGGVFRPSHLALGAPGGMFITIGAGECLMPGTSNAAQGLYYGYNDASVTLAVTASDPTNPRLDAVCATVQDANYAGGLTQWLLQVVTGLPLALPVLPTLPASTLLLGAVHVAAGATAISIGNIDDYRPLTSGAAPVGSLRTWPGPVHAAPNSMLMLPGGYVPTDGRSLATATYPDLFAIVGYTFGGAGGAFNIPTVAPAGGITTLIRIL